MSSLNSSLASQLAKRLAVDEPGSAHITGSAEKPNFASDSTLDMVKQFSISEMADPSSDDHFKIASTSSRDIRTDNSFNYASQDFGNQQQAPGMVSQISQCASSAQLAPSAYATSSVICIICNKLKEDKLFWETHDCDHSYTICKNCIRVHIRKCIETGEKEIKCLYPECSASISKDYVLLVVQQELDKDLLMERLNSPKQQVPSPLIQAPEPGAAQQQEAAKKEPPNVNSNEEELVSCKCIIN